MTDTPLQDYYNDTMRDHVRVILGDEQLSISDKESFIKGLFVLGAARATNIAANQGPEEFEAMVNEMRDVKNTLIEYVVRRFVIPEVMKRAVDEAAKEEHL